MNEKEWCEGYNAFREKYPDCPIAEDIETLSLIMKREYAEAINQGTKTVEFRSFSPFYINKLYDKKVDEWIAAHPNNEDVKTAIKEMYVCALKHVHNLHFYNYNKSWTMDVECIENGVIMLCKEDVKMLQDEFNCHELDDDLKRLEALGVPEDERPLLFYFACGKVLDANFDGKPKKEEVVGFCGGEIYKVMDRIIENDDDTKILTFKVNKEMFDGIVNDQIGVFTKEITKRYLNTFIVLNEDGTVKEINGIPQLRPYDALQFTNKDDSYTCRINDAEVVYQDYESGEYKLYSKQDEDERGDITDYLIAYTLGDKI